MGKLQQNVADAVCIISTNENHLGEIRPYWRIVLAHLLSQDAELKVLRVKCAGTLANNLCPDHRDKQVGKPCLACAIEKAESGLAKHVNRVCELQARLAAANALLREIMEFGEDRKLHTRIQSHLQGAGDEV